MIQIQLKLNPTSRQERQLTHWLFHLTAVWNWAIAKIDRDADAGIAHSSLGFRSLLAGHGAKLGISSDALKGTLWTAYTDWQRCFKKKLWHCLKRKLMRRLQGVTPPKKDEE